MDNLESLTHHHQAACKLQRELASTRSKFTEYAVDGDVEISITYNTSRGDGEQTVVVSVEETTEFLDKLLSDAAYNRLEVEDMIKEQVNKVQERV